MKKLYSSLAAVMAFVMLLSCSITANAVSPDEWNANWATTEEKRYAAVTMTPGADDTERYISWYSDSDSGCVVLINVLGAEIIYNAVATKTPQGDYRLTAVVNNINAESTYQYYCKSGDWKSEVYDILPDEDSSFTAVYLSDIHVSYDKYPENSLRDTAYNYNLTLETAINKAESLGNTLELILSAGDQASDGRRDEYTALVSNEHIKEIPFAMCIGNHDRKSADYRFFNAVQPNTVDMTVKSYVGTDYAFVKGDVLFMVFDSNNISMADHRKFARNAVEENPDTRWRVAVLHHDLYSARIPSRESENQWLRMMWAPIADEFGIDLCLTGHSHYYTISNVMYNNKTVDPTADGDIVTNANGTVFMVTGSLNNPRNDDNIGLSENVGHAYLTEEKIYNLIDFSKESIVINSYTVESDTKIGSLTINKSSNQGGHSYSTPAEWYYPVVEVISAIAGVINNIGRYYDNVQLGFDIPFFEGIFG